MFERYTERARRVVFFARYEASVFGGTSIDTGHLLLGLLREGQALTARILSRHGVRHRDVGREIEARQAAAREVSTDVDIPLAADAQRALQHAAAEADQMDAPHIGTEHLLLGLLDEGQGVGAEILAGKGLRADAVREELRLAAGAKAPAGRLPAFAKLVRFLTQLEERGAGFRVASYLEDAIRVEVTLMGEIRVATFFADGRVALEVFSAHGSVEDEEGLERLLERLDPPRREGD
jgi:ATP-dependent Clp protease ATP-binding subunit ClpC